MAAPSRDPYARLAAALKRAPFTEEELAALRLRLEPGARHIISALRAGRPSKVEAFLAAHAVKGWDPLTSRPADPQMPAPGWALAWWFFGLSLRLTRMAADGGEITARCAARLARVSTSTWSRAENGKPVNVPHFLALCAVMDRHPHDLCAGRSTGNGHCNARNSQSSAPATVAAE